MRPFLFLFFGQGNHTPIYYYFSMLLLSGAEFMTIQLTATVHRLDEGGAMFQGLNSWYHVPPDLMPILRTALETRREVKITKDRVNDRMCILAVELLPPLPMLARLRNKVAELRIGVELWRRGWPLW